MIKKTIRHLKLVNTVFIAICLLLLPEAVAPLAGVGIDIFFGGYSSSSQYFISIPIL
jgi:hypothetical protein